MKKVEAKTLRGDKQEIEGKLMLKEEKIYVLKDYQVQFTLKGKSLQSWFRHA